MTIAEKSTRYGISAPTVKRMDAAGRAAGVAPPWDDPHALHDWYVEHYRSDPGAPVKQNRQPPDWIMRAVESAPARVEAPVIPPPVEVRNARRAAAVEEDDEESEVESGARSLGVELSSSEGLAFARQLIKDQALAIEQMSLGPLREQAFKKYLGNLGEIQKAEERNRKMGEARKEFMSEATAAVRDMLLGLKRRLKADLIVLRKDAGAACPDPDTWIEFLEKSLTDILRRAGHEKFGMLIGEGAK